MRGCRIKDISIYLLAAIAVIATVSTAILRQVPAVARAQDSPPQALALVEEIISRFPDRKTSSYEASQFLSFAAAFLKGEGWYPSITDYHAVVKSSSADRTQTTYVSVSGQNLLAFPSQTPPGTIDLLLVAPYDTATPDDAEFLPLRAYTAEASASLLSLSSEIRRSGSLTVALALVSGHYQLGAGAEALLKTLDEKGLTVKSVLVLGDMYSSNYLPLVANNYLDLESLRASYDDARAAGLRPHIVGIGNSTWYEVVSKAPSGSPTVDTLLGTSDFPGEGSVFAQREIPALTVGFPRGSYLASKDRQGLETLDPERASKVLSLLAALSQTGALLKGTPDLPAAGGFPDPFAGGPAVFQAFDRMVVFEQKTVSLAGLAMCAFGTLVLIFCRRLLDARGLALTGGIALAATASFTISGALFSSVSGRYTSWAFPVLPLSMVGILFAGLTLLGFLRIWSVRSRIAHLHRKAYPNAPDSPLHGNGPGVGGNGNEVRTTAGAWGLALILAVTAGTGLKGSPFFPCALASSVLMCLSVVIEGIRLRHNRSLGAWVWVNRALYLAPLGAALLWAGSPTESEVLTRLGTGITHVSPETVASLLSVAASSASLISTFRFPKPAEKRRGLLLLAEIITLAGMLAAVFALPKITPGSVPAHVVDYESPSDWAVIEVSRSESNAGVALDATLLERPTFLALDIKDTVRARSGSSRAAVSKVMGIDALLGVSEEDDGDSEPFELPSGNSIRLVWWYPPEFVFSKKLGLDPKSIISVELSAVYLGRSYPGPTLEPPEASLANVTRVAKSIVLR